LQTADWIVQFDSLNAGVFVQGLEQVSLSFQHR
jgi:hypothetical protein